MSRNAKRSAPHCEPVEAGKGPPWERGREAGGKVADPSERSGPRPAAAGREGNQTWLPSCSARRSQPWRCSSLELRIGANSSRRRVAMPQAPSTLRTICRCAGGPLRKRSRDSGWSWRNQQVGAAPAQQLLPSPCPGCRGSGRRSPAAGRGRRSPAATPAGRPTRPGRRTPGARPSGICRCASRQVGFEHLASVRQPSWRIGSKASSPSFSSRTT